jgi:hypothetical protein
MVHQHELNKKIHRFMHSLMQQVSNIKVNFLLLEHPMKLYKHDIRLQLQLPDDIEQGVYNGLVVMLEVCVD